MKITALALALAFGLGLTAAQAQVPAKPAAPAAVKVDCSKAENKAHADCKAPGQVKK